MIFYTEHIHFTAPNHPGLITVTTKVIECSINVLPKILTFVQINNAVSDALNIASGVYAICICATDYPMELSVLVKSSFLSFDEDGKSQYTMLSLHYIKGPAYCIENVVDKSVEYNYKDCSQVFVVDSGYFEK